MAEFVSAIVALVAVGAQVGNSLLDISTAIKDAPDEFQKLWIEEAEFRRILTEVLEARQLGQPPMAKNKSHNDIDTVIERSFEKLREVRILVQKLSKQQYGSKETLRVDRLKWITKVKKARKMQEDLRLQKSAIQTIKSDASVREIIEKVQMQTQFIAHTRDILIEKQDMQLETLRQIAQFTHGSFGQQMDRSHMITGSSSPHQLLSLEDTLGNLGDQAEIKSEKNPTMTVTDGVLTNFNTSSSPPKVMSTTSVSRRIPLMCFDDCTCRCHQRSFIRSPRRLSTYMGDLFLGYSSLPPELHSVDPCNKQTCRRSKGSKVDVKFYLPAWLTLNSVRFSLAFSMTRVPISVSLQTRNTIPYDSPIHLAVQGGHIDDVKDILVSGSSSLSDVDPYGLGLLYYASYYCRRSSGGDVAMDMCGKLLALGAHADWEDEIGNTPLETMTEDVLAIRMNDSKTSSELTEGELVDVARIFGTCTNDLLDDYIEDRGFTTLHQVLLGIELGHGSLVEYLSSLNKVSLVSQIDVADARGRTPLAWAVEFGCPDAVSTLLQYGANPHQVRKNLRGASPLLHLVIAAPPWQQSGADSNIRSLEVVRILLEAGADVNAKDHEGWTPLHVAASWNLCDIIQEIVRHGGSTIDWDALTDDGDSALDLCRNGDLNEEVESMLVTRGVSEEKELDTVSHTSESTLPENRNLTEQYFDAPQGPGSLTSNPEQSQMRVKS